MTDSTDTEVHEHRAHPVLHVVAPIVALGVTWAARSAMNAGYTRLTGKKPPIADDPSVNLARALAWTIVTASTAAVIEMVIYRASSRMTPSP